MILTKRLVTIRAAENNIVIHKKEIDIILTFNGMPLPSL